MQKGTRECFAGMGVFSDHTVVVTVLHNCINVLKATELHTDNR